MIPPEFGPGPRTAIVTGGARRIGLAFAEARRGDGWTLIVHCHRSCDEADISAPASCASSSSQPRSPPPSAILTLLH